VRARYKAEFDVIAAQYEKWKLAGPPEVRADGGGSFSGGKSRQSRQRWLAVWLSGNHPDAK